MGWLKPVAARLLEPLLVLACYAGAATVVTYPLVNSFGRRFLGSERSDLWFHVWGYWWMKESLLQHHRFPLHTDHINYPGGGTLMLIDPLGSLLSVPLQLLFGLIVAYNLLALGNLIFAGAAGYYLIRHLLRPAGAARPWPVCLPALVGGLIFGFSPHLLGQIENGITETFHAGWIAVYVLLLLRTFDEQKIRLAVAMGLLLFVTFFANAYYGIFCLLFSVVLLLYTLVFKRRSIFHRRFLVAMVVAVGVFSVVAVPYYRVFSAAFDSSDSLVQRNPQPPPLDQLVRNKAFITEAYSFFLPYGHGADPSRTAGDHFTNITYLGYLPLLLLLAGAILARRHRSRHLWTMLFVIYFVLSMGPVLVLNGQVTSVGDDSYLTLPFYHLFTSVPYLCLVSHPYRVTVMTMLALAVLGGGYAMHTVLGWLPRWWLRLGLTALVLVGVLAETVQVSPVIQPMSQKDGAMPRFYGELGRTSKSGALINLPLSFCGTNQRRIYYYYQTAHGQKLPFVIEKTITPLLQHNGLTAHLYYLEWRSDPHTLRPYFGYRTTPGDLQHRVQQGVQQLKKLGFKHLVLDRRFFLPSQRRSIPGIAAFLHKHLGKPKQYEPYFLVYAI